jgi:predicted nucleic acid-binding protein
VSIYLDASVLVALFTDDRFTRRADAFLRANASVLIVSDFAAAEFASVIARHVRTGDITPNDARVAFSTFDAWTARAIQRTEIRAADVTAAEAFLRRLDLTLRTPDALNIAIAQRIGATLVTFDNKMIASARALGTPVAGA